MGKKVSARIKNKMKARFARAISLMERSVAKGGAYEKDFRKKGKK